MKKIKFYDPKFTVCIAFAICIIISILLYPFLPMDLPMQFASDGSVNWSLPKYLGIFPIPAIGAIITSYYIKIEQFTYTQLASVCLLLALDIGFLSYIAFFR